MKDGLEQIPRKPRSSNRKRKFDILQQNAKNESEKLKYSIPNINHNDGEASESSRPDKSVEKPKPLPSDPVDKLSKEIELWKAGVERAKKRLEQGKNEKIEEYIRAAEYIISVNERKIMEKLSTEISQWEDGVKRAKKKLEQEKNEKVEKYIRTAEYMISVNEQKINTIKIDQKKRKINKTEEEFLNDILKDII